MIASWTLKSQVWATWEEGKVDAKKKDFSVLIRSQAVRAVEIISPLPLRSTHCISPVTKVGWDWRQAHYGHVCKPVDIVPVSGARFREVCRFAVARNRKDR